MGWLSFFGKKKMGAFRAEVTIETWRLWREMIEDYRRKNPHDSIAASMSVAEEAIYMSTNSPLKEQVYLKAVASVKKMTRYYVQEYEGGKAVHGWEEIYANSDQEAAEKVAGPNLRRAGKLGELRARVRPVATPQAETDFYATE